MKSLAAICVVLFVFAATSLAKNCNVKNNVLSPGQTIVHPDAECVRLRCLNDGSTEYLGCPSTALAEGCRDEGYENPNRPYPDCCKRIIKCN